MLVKTLTIFSGKEMEKDMKKLICLMITLVFCVTIFTGCGNSNNPDSVPNYGKAADIKIALLGSNEQFEEKRDFLIGMEIALKELKEQGINISCEKIDDGDSKDSGVALAKDVAVNNEYSMAFTFQANETVDTIASIFEEEKKPLIIVDECYDSTMQKGFDYILSGVISAEDCGNALIKYCEDNNIEWVATAHSGTIYEMSLAKGFGSAASDSKKTYLVDSTAGPYRIAELLNVFNRWKTLGVQAAFITFDDVEWTCEVIQQIRKLDKNMLILSDTGINDIRYLEKYKDVLEGVVVAGTYNVDSNDRLKEFYNKYEKRIMQEQNFDITSITAQGYDFVNMVTQKFKESRNANEFMQNMKSSQGYEGFTGVRFKANGQIDKSPCYWMVKNGQMYRI